MCDIVIRDGLVVDGTGSPGKHLDVGIKDGKIVEVATRITDKGRQEIDATGLVVAPGFIDTHSHSDLMLLANPSLEEKIRQGVTTEILGQDGLGLAPIPSSEAASMLTEHLAGLLGRPDMEWSWRTFDEYLNTYQNKGTVLNVGALVSHGALRIAVFGMEDRPATAAEVDAMQSLLVEALEAGAMGLSTGLIYPPCNFADRKEMVMLGETLAHYSRALVVHVRNEADNLLEAQQEMISLAKETNMHLHISHFKTIGKKNWHKIDDSLALIEGAKEKGLCITADQYPYIAGSTSLSACLPHWAMDGGPKAMLARLTNEDMRQKIKDAFKTPVPNWQNRGETEGWENVVVASVRSDDPAVVGRSIAELSQVKAKHPVDVIMDILVREENQATMVCFQNSEENVKKVMQKPWVMVCTDGILGGGKPHPRLYGSFPRVLGKYVREENVISLEEAVRKMTALPAAAFGLADRGIIKEGLAADVVLFDPETVRDTSTYEDPIQYPVGFEYVIVNGVPVISEGNLTGDLPGKVLLAR